MKNMAARPDRRMVERLGQKVAEFTPDHDGMEFDAVISVEMHKGAEVEKCDAASQAGEWMPLVRRGDRPRRRNSLGRENRAFFFGNGGMRTALSKVSTAVLELH